MFRYTTLAEMLSENKTKRFCFDVIGELSVMATEARNFFENALNLNGNISIKGDFTKCPNRDNTYVIVSNDTEDQQRHIDQLSAQVSNSDDVVKLLDHVNWRIFIYSCEQTCSNFLYSQNEFSNDCPNSTCCFSNRIDDLLFHSSRFDDKYSNYLNSIVMSAWFGLLILGLLCLLGNGFVIHDKTKRLIKTVKTVKEIQIYQTLVLNLALSDLLMGVYLTAMAFELKHKTTPGDEYYFSHPGICNGLAIINTVSSQVSITILFIISVYRLVSVTKPFRTHHFKSVIFLIIVTWAVWIMVAILPLLPVEPFETIFTFGLTKNRQQNGKSIIDFARFRAILQTKILPNFDNFSEVKSILQQVIEFPTPAVLEKFSNVLGLLHSETDNWTLLGYYDFIYSCSANFIYHREQYYHSNHFGLSFVFYNLILSIGTLICYILVTVKISKYDKCCFATCKSCTSKLSCHFTKFLCNNAFFQHQENTVVGSRSAENLRMLKRITVIVLTDVICWIPVCVSSLVIWQLPVNSTFETGISFYIATLVLVPLNSIINPYIYSIHLWGRLLNKLRP